MKILVIGSSVIIFSSTACAASPVSLGTTNQYYEAQMACVDAGVTREQIDNCRAAAKVKFNGELLDGGKE